MIASGLLDQQTRSPGAPVRLVCFPYAGAGTSCFRHLAHRLRGSVDLIRVRLPGREELLDRSPPERMEAVLDALVPELEPLVRGRTCFLGYSLGALVAFEAARALQRGARPLERLLACASVAPSVMPRDEAEGVDDDDTLLARLRNAGATPLRLLEDRSVMRVLLPAIRADFRVLDNYRFEAGARLRCAIDAIGGRSDANVSADDLHAWRRHTASACEVSWLPGGHFFLHDSPEAFEQRVLGALGERNTHQEPARP